MKLSNMFKKTSRRGYISLGEGKPAHMAPEVPEGLLKKCNVCKSAILTEDVKNVYLSKMSELFPCACDAPD